MSRSSWTMASLALGAGALVAAVVLVSPDADATQGQPVIAGRINTATDLTSVEDSAPGGTGLVGTGDDFGLAGLSDADGGTGVYGSNLQPTGVGVEGDVAGSGSGVFGVASGAGVGVNGLSDSGVGVEARSSTGTALKVVGKVSFNRSGVVTIPAGASSATVQLGRVTTTSMVLATAQQAKSAFVKAAVPAAGRLTILLTATAPVGGLKVAYFVLN